MQRKSLSNFQTQLLEKLSPLIIPPNGPAVPRFQASLIQRMDRFVFELPPVLRLLFNFGMWLFDFAAVFFAAPHRCFIRLSEPHRFRYLQRMSRSWLRPVRDWLFTCRGLILLFYYSQPEVMAALHYDPETWAREKIQARRQALDLTEPLGRTPTPAIPIELSHDPDD
ncbi:MAG: hypothetical protein ONA90_04725 [candidate division KSB1 bacterium]|nr:hypothetical protein [candidate division KSB1 bacterium]